MDRTVSTALARFSARFLDELDTSKSLVASPTTEVLLSLLALGATDKTPEELSVLAEVGFPVLFDDLVGANKTSLIHAASAQVSSRLRNIDNTLFHAANKICMNKVVEVETEKNDIAEAFDFKDGGAIAKHRNDWVDEKSHHKIQSILTPNGVKDDQEIVLINAIYFKGDWQNPFNVARTADLDFYPDANTSIKVSTMGLYNKLPYKICDELDSQFLVLPCIGELKMAIILPNSIEPDAVKTILKKIANGYDLMEMIKSIKNGWCTYAQLPKFTIESEINLTEVLKKLGIKSIFDHGLSILLNCKRPVHVREATQRVVIEVNQEGTRECTEISGFRQHRRGCKQLRHDFRADHPFLYVLIGPGDIPLLMGIYRGDENAPRTEFNYEGDLRTFTETRHRKRKADLVALALRRDICERVIPSYTIL